MGAATSSDVNFIPKVWSDHAMAYFDRRMALGSLAIVDKTLEAAPGDTVNFPYYKKLGDVQEPTEDEGLAVDKLIDDSFAVTVKEVGKAVGWKDGNRRKSAQRDPEGEAQRQLGILYAEKLDKDLMSLINTPGNYASGLTSVDGTDTLTIQKLLKHNISVFGDKAEDTVAYAMHSLNWLDLMSASGTGFLQKIDNDPFNGLPGFQGRILNRPAFVLDSMPQVTSIGGQKTFAVYSFKANPFGIYMANEFQLEKDRDILHRENLVASTLWYGVLGLHAKISVRDLRVARSVFATSMAG